MKKLIAAIVIASIGAAFADPILVYEYKASIKRLDLKLRTDKKANAVAEKYVVVSDTITGFVTLPKCDDCETGGVDNTVLGEDNSFDNALDEFRGKAYLVLKGNKYAANHKRAILETEATAMGGVFGAETYTTGTNRGKPIEKKQLTKAWMALDFVMPAGSQTVLNDFDASEMIKIAKDSAHPVYLGFYGVSNNGNEGVKVQNTGFGTAKVDPGTSDFTICGQTSTEDCLMINTISGTLVGYPTYLGPCGITPLWDVCDITANGQEEQAVISGTWSLKFNKSLSSLSTAEKKEEEIYKKLGGKDKNGYFIVNTTGTVTYPEKKSDKSDK